MKRKWTRGDYLFWVMVTILGSAILVYQYVYAPM